MYSDPEYEEKGLKLIMANYRKPEFRVARTVRQRDNYENHLWRVGKEDGKTPSDYPSFDSLTDEEKVRWDVDFDDPDQRLYMAVNQLERFSTWEERRALYEEVEYKLAKNLKGALKETQAEMKRRGIDEFSLLPKWIDKKVRQEMVRIKKRAVDKGTYLKAPNGETSNLDSVQWLMVRTKSFKAWFGDWEKKPWLASKIVDENGEPLVCYHGTNMAGFTKFEGGGPNWVKDESIRSKMSFFTSDYKVAKEYASFGPGGGSNWKDGGGVYEVFLNIREVEKRDLKGMAEWELVKESWREGETVPYRQVWLTDKIAYRAAKSGKYDGVWLVDLEDPLPGGDEIVCFDNRNIKDAKWNSGGFDSENPDITMCVAEDRKGNRLPANMFVANERGEEVWFVMPAMNGRGALPVVLRVGRQGKNHKGYGLIHIVKQRADEGYWEKDAGKVGKSATPAEFLRSIFRGASALYQSKTGREMIVKGTEPYALAITELREEESGQFLSIVSAYLIDDFSAVEAKYKKIADLKNEEASLVERVPDVAQGPTNPEGNPGRLDSGTEVDVAPRSYGAGRKLSAELLNKYGVVNIDDVVVKLDEKRNVKGNGYMETLSLGDLFDMVGSEGLAERWKENSYTNSYVYTSLYTRKSSQYLSQSW